MPHRRVAASSKPTPSMPLKMNAESCPNSFLNVAEPRERDILKSRRNRRLESSPIRDSFHMDKPTTAAPVNMSATQSACNTAEFYSKLKGTPQSSSERIKNYCQPNESMLQQYTLMTFSSGPMMSSLYPNYNVSVPYLPSRYSPYFLQNKVNGSPVQVLPKEKNNQSTTYHGQSFPAFFNPRTASNMPHKEKVNNWIENIPIFEIEGGTWESNCYDSNYSMNWEENEFDDASKMSNISFITHDELLFLQGKKFESLVRKLYKSEYESRNSRNDPLLDNPTLTDFI